MSLNGDIHIMRNGRSASQVSVYNYPEHLNPFYEDDQHKRLRFWHINKQNENGSRRNSFSLSGLKDIWAFKSFRLKKKSSTLGINKTSESPPTLRRNVQYYLSTANSNNNNNFIRNVPYRSSLQNMNSTNDYNGDFGLTRNDQYRRTIQFTNESSKRQQSHHTLPQSRRYVYGGSVTPQPLRNTDIGKENLKEVLLRGSSQTSMASTNPFDTDNEEEVFEGIITDDRATLSPVPKKKACRKKRHAPAPPIVVPKSNTDDHLNNSTESWQKPEQDLQTLTAEIESFVKNVDIVSSEEVPLNKVNTNPTSGNIKDKNLNNERANDCSTMIMPEIDISKETQTLKTYLVEAENIDSSEEVPHNKISNKFAVGNSQNVKSNGEITSYDPNMIIVAKAISDDSRLLANEHIIDINVDSLKEDTLEKVNNNATTDSKQDVKSYDETANDNLNTNMPSTSMFKEIQQFKNHNVDSYNTIAEDENLSKTEIGHVECIHIHMDNIKNTKEQPDQNRFTTFRLNDQTNYSENIMSKQSFTLASPPKVITTDEDEKHSSSIMQEDSVLRIEEEISDLNLNSIELKETNSIPIKIIQTNLEKTKFPVTTQTNQNVDNHDSFVHIPKRESIGINKNVFIPDPSNFCKLQTSSEECSDTKLFSSVEKKAINPNYDFKPSARPLKIFEMPGKEVNNYCVTGNKKSTKNINSEDSHTLEENNTKELDLQRTVENPLVSYRANLNSELWKKSTLAPLEKNIPPERRKSVKDIIESINRSQRLLNSSAHKNRTYCLNTNIEEHSNKNEVFQSICKKKDMKDLPENTNTMKETSLNLCSTRKLVVESHKNYLDKDESQKQNNAEILMKFRVNKEVYDYRESSPTASNLDWNPVPKPKRTKNVSEFYESDSNEN